MSKHGVVSEVDFTTTEQEHVRNALYFLRAKFGSWEPIAKLLRFEQGTIANAAAGHRNVTASMVMRLAKLLGVPVETLTRGSFPEPGTCPRCGYRVPLDGRFKNASPSVTLRGAR